MLIALVYIIRQTLNNTDIFTSNKDKAPASTSSIEAYNKKTLNDKICRLTTTNAQLITDKIKPEKNKINLEVNRIQLFDKKNSLVTKRKEFKTEIITLNAAGSFNVSVRKYQDPFLKPT